MLYRTKFKQKAPVPSGPICFLLTFFSTLLPPTPHNKEFGHFGKQKNKEIRAIHAENIKNINA